MRADLVNHYPFENFRMPKEKSEKNYLLKRELNKLWDHWNEKKMVEFAKKANLKYLAQGVDHKDWEKPQVVDGVYLFGHHLTIKDAKIEDMIQYIESNKLPMLLLHPEDLFINGVKEKFLKILKVAKAVSVKDALESRARRSCRRRSDCYGPSSEKRRAMCGTLPCASRRASAGP